MLDPKLNPSHNSYHDNINSKLLRLESIRKKKGSSFCRKNINDKSALGSVILESKIPIFQKKICIFFALASKKGLKQKMKLFDDLNK